MSSSGSTPLIGEITPAVIGLYLAMMQKITTKRQRNTPDRARPIETSEPRAITDARLATATGGRVGGKMHLEDVSLG